MSYIVLDMLHSISSTNLELGNTIYRVIDDTDMVCELLTGDELFKAMKQLGDDKFDSLISMADVILRTSDVDSIIDHKFYNNDIVSAVSNNKGNQWRFIFKEYKSKVIIKIEKYRDIYFNGVRLLSSESLEGYSITPVALYRVSDYLFKLVFFFEDVRTPFIFRNWYLHIYIDARTGNIVYFRSYDTVSKQYTTLEYKDHFGMVSHPIYCHLKDSDKDMLLAKLITFNHPLID